MVLGLVLKISAIGATLAGAILFLIRAREVGLGQAGSEIGEALQGIGSGGSAIGKGIQDTLTGLGVGAARLFDPLFTLRNLIFSNVNPQTVGGQQEARQSRPNQTNATVTGIRSGTRIFSPMRRRPSRGGSVSPEAIVLGTSVIRRGSLTGGFLTQSNKGL